MKAQSPPRTHFSHPLLLFACFGFSLDPLENSTPKFQPLVISVPQGFMLCTAWPFP